MKKNAKNSSFFRLELGNYSVVIRFATAADELLHGCMYSVVFCDNRDPKQMIVKIFGFKHFEDAHAYVFENYACMFIPSRLFLNEGHHLFVY